MVIYNRALGESTHPFLMPVIITLPLSGLHVETPPSGKSRFRMFYSDEFDDRSTRRRVRLSPADARMCMHELWRETLSYEPEKNACPSPAESDFWRNAMTVTAIKRAMGKPRPKEPAMWGLGGLRLGVQEGCRGVFVSIECAVLFSLVSGPKSHFQKLTRAWEKRHPRPRRRQRSDLAKSESRDVQAGGAMPPEVLTDVHRRWQHFNRCVCTNEGWRGIFGENLWWMALRYERDGECWCQRRPSVVKAYFDHRLLQEFIALFGDVVDDVLKLALDVGFPDLVIYSVRPPLLCWLVEVKTLTDSRRKTQSEFHRRVLQTRSYALGHLRIGTVLAHDPKKISSAEARAKPLQWTASPRGDCAI